MDIEEVKKELTNTMVEMNAGYDNDPSEEEYALGYASGCEYAIELLEKSQEKKVKIPEFVANDIDGRKKEGSTLRDALEDGFDWGMESDVYYWFLAANGDENVRKYISAWDNGYEVEVDD